MRPIGVLAVTYRQFLDYQRAMADLIADQRREIEGLERDAARLAEALVWAKKQVGPHSLCADALGYINMDVALEEHAAIASSETGSKG